MKHEQHVDAEMIEWMDKAHRQKMRQRLETTMNFDHEHRRHKVELCDDGTLDTVIEVDGLTYRFDQEVASDFRLANGSFNRSGLRRLAIEALDNETPVEEEDENEEEIENSIMVLVDDYGYSSDVLVGKTLEELTDLIKKAEREDRGEKRRERRRTVAHRVKAVRLFTVPRKKRRKVAVSKKLPKVSGIQKGRVVFK